jgi:hypothetical protein
MAIPNNKTVVIVSGWKKSGKDEMADRLVSLHGFTRLSFAKGLKDQVAHRYGIERSHCDDQAFKEKPLMNYPVQLDDRIVAFLMPDMSEHYKEVNSVLYHTPRSIMILEGTFYGRAVDKNIWANTVARQIKSSESNRIVISDCRFPNELGVVDGVPGITVIDVRVNRFDTTSATDPSERSLDDHKFGIVLDNKGTLKEYHDKIDLLVSKLN